MDDGIDETTVTPAPRDALSDAISTLQFAKVELIDVTIKLTQMEFKVALALRLLQELKGAQPEPASPLPTP